MSIYRRVLAYYRPFLPHTILGLLLSFAGIGLNLLKPWPFKIIVDDVIPRFSLGANVHFPFNESWWNQSPKTLVLILCLVLVVIQAVWSLLSWGTTYIFVKIGLEALLKLRTDLYSHLQRLLSNTTTRVVPPTPPSASLTTLNRSRRFTIAVLPTFLARP